MRVAVRHLTRYVYDGAVELGPHLIRLRPATHAQARLLSYNLVVSPDNQVHWQYDPWGNRIARVTFEMETGERELEVLVEAAFEIRSVNPFDFFVDSRCRDVPFAYPDGLAEELAPFLAHETPGPRLQKWLREIPAEGYVTDHLVAVVKKVAKDVGYIIRNEAGIQSSEDTLTIGSGSCRDSALLLCDALRAQGFAARFVSGYLVQLTDEGNIPGEAKGVSEDVVDLHAWCEVYLPGAGWVGLDGTSGLLTGEGHIPLASAVRPSLAAPIDGTASRAAARFDFEMDVTRLGHEPRPRRPYTDEQWQALRRVGCDIDEGLENAGVVLTMGGEPTWTSRERPHEPEWQTEALGPSKWTQGLRLAKELAPRLAPGGLTMQRMGKLYPGESLPRWVLHLLWRRDHKPIWKDPTLLHLGPAPDGHHPRQDSDPARLELAERMAGRIAKRIGIEAHLSPGYEDPWIAIVREMNLPDDVDPLAADLEDAEQRRTLARMLGRGLGRPVGFALPIAHDGTGFRGDRWTFRRQHMFLIEGDSPMGLR
ncbi:MAG: transglutaminase family protein, partial [Myxococcota bacterium]